MAFVKSNNIKVFPTGFRGGHLKEDVTTGEKVTVLFDPESKLNTERNLTNLINYISRKISGANEGEDSHAYNTNGDGVIINVETTADVTKVEFLLHGYYFQIENFESFINDSGLTSAEQANAIYACITTKDHASQNGNLTVNSGFKANTLVNLENDDNWDNLDTEQSTTTASDDSLFKGLLISNNPLSSAEGTVYNLKLFDSVTEAGGETAWMKRRSHINDFRFDITDIQSTSKVYINNALVLQALSSAINQYFESEDVKATKKFTIGAPGESNIVAEVTESGDVKADVTNSEINLGNGKSDYAPTVNLNVAKIKATELEESGDTGDINEIDLRTQEVESDDTKYGKSSVMIDLPRTARTYESGDINAETLQKVFKEHYVDNTKYGNKAYDAVPEGYMQIRINQGKTDVGDIISSGSLKSEADVIEVKSPDDEYESSWIRLDVPEDGDKSTGLKVYQWIKARWPAWNKSFLGMRIYSTTNYNDSVIKDISDRVNRNALEKHTLNSYSGAGWSMLTGDETESSVNRLILQATSVDNNGYDDPLDSRTSFTKFDSYTGQYEVMDYCWLDYYDDFGDPHFVTKKHWVGQKTDEPIPQSPTSPTKDNPYVPEPPTLAVGKTYLEARFGGTWVCTYINEIYYETDITSSTDKDCYRHWIIQGYCEEGTITPTAGTYQPLFKSYKGFIALNTIHDISKVCELFGGDPAGNADWIELTGHTTDGQLHQWQRQRDPDPYK